MVFDISDKDDSSRPRKETNPGLHPFGEHDSPYRAESQFPAAAKNTDEFKSTWRTEEVVDFSKCEPMKMLADGRYAVVPGEYYIVSSESIDFANPDDSVIYDAILDPSIDTDTRPNQMIGGYIGGEPVYSTREGWSGVSNTFMSKKLYDALVKRGMKYTADGSPSVIVFTKPTTLGAVNGDATEGNSDYGMMEVGDRKVNLFSGDGSIVLSDRTVID